MRTTAIKTIHNVPPPDLHNRPPLRLVAGGRCPLHPIELRDRKYATTRDADYNGLVQTANEILEYDQQISKPWMHWLKGEQFFTRVYYRVSDDRIWLCALFASMATPPPMREGKPRDRRLFLVDGDCNGWLLTPEEQLGRRSSATYGLSKYHLWLRRQIEEYGDVWLEKVLTERGYK